LTKPKPPITSTMKANIRIIRFAMGPLQTRNQRACESKDEAPYRSAGIEIADRKAK
jgi:hypothetical protein